MVRKSRLVTGTFAGVLVGFVLLGTLPSATAQTGKENPQQTIKREKDRWAVKTAIDPGASEIDTRAIKVTVEELLAMQRPADMSDGKGDPKYQNLRAKPVETTVYVVEAKIVECRHMPDGDYRVKIEGKSGKTMYVEMPNPDPEFVSSVSRFQKDMVKVRKKATDKLKPEAIVKPVSIYAKLTGVGFFGWSKNMQGQPVGNGIQLHPVLKVDWMKEPKNNDRSNAGKP